MRTHDVIVVGGSLAGAACVRELERLSIDAIAFERDHFPRRKVCGGFVSPGGVDCLAQLGLLDAVRNAGATVVSSANIRVGALDIEIPLTPAGLGISRTVLDELVARGTNIQQGCAVIDVFREGSNFIVRGPNIEAACKVVVDATGKLSRLTRRIHTDEFGVQFFDTGTRAGILDFWFFEDGYGGAVSVEGGQGNYCFLIKKDKLANYIHKPDRMVTGPAAYERLPGEFVAIGDAAGMVDPFCGEGMRHALDGGILAARIVSRGLRARTSYEHIRSEYWYEWSRRWSRRRAIATSMRWILRNRKVLSRALRLGPERFLNRFWQ